MQVQLLSNEDFKDKLRKSPIAIVDVFASWCGPCLRFSPVFEKAAEQYDQFQFFKLDAEESPDFRNFVEVPVLPFVLAFKNGELLKSDSLTTVAGLGEFLNSIPID